MEKIKTSIREICISKSTEVLTRRVIIRACSFLGGVKGFIKNNPAVFFQFRAPNSFVHEDAFISRFIVTAFSAVCHILRMSANSQVVALVVEGIVPVNMICIHIFGGIHDDSVHVNQFLPPPKLSGRITHSIPFKPFVLKSTPFPLIDSFKIFVVNQCEFTLREWNLFCHLFSNAKHPLIVQLSRLPHGAVNNQRVLWNYKAKTVQSNLDKFNYNMGVSL